MRSEGMFTKRNPGKSDMDARAAIQPIRNAWLYFPNLLAKNKSNIPATANAKRASPAVDFNWSSVYPAREALLGAPTAVPIALVFKYVGMYKRKTKTAPI